MSPRAPGRRRQSLPTETGIPEENTLGIVVGRAGRAMASTAKRLTRPGSPYRAGLGGNFLALGAGILVGLRALYGLVQFFLQWSEYPQPLIAAIAWVVLIATLAAVLVTARVVGDRLPTPIFLAVLAGLAASFVLDVTAVWQLHDIGRTVTAASVSGMALLVMVTLRGRIELTVAAAAFGLALAVCAFLDTDPLDSRTIATQILAVAATALPAIIGINLVEGFRYLVQVELDRALVQSTVQAPRFAVGMLASEELARLDLAAEELFDNIAGGKVRLPLSPRSSSVAASLATELRLHLIEGRRETWLYHAVSESEMLGKGITLVDKSSLAGLLDPGQRDGLLQTAWMLVNDTRKASAARSVSLQLGPAAPAAGATSKVSVPIVITTTGIARNRVDPSIWDALGRVGRYSDSTQDSSLRVDIECLVDNPAEV
jgi:hypothetical protein